MLKMWVSTKYKPAPDEEGLPMFGVAGENIGKRRIEYCSKRSIQETGKVCTFVLRPDQVVIREIVRRKIILSMYFLRCMLWGCVDIKTMENYQPRIWTEGSEILVTTMKMIMSVAMMNRPLMRKTISRYGHQKAYQLVGRAERSCWRAKQGANEETSCISGGMYEMVQGWALGSRTRMRRLMEQSDAIPGERWIGWRF
jgi:hypothetical protein